MFKRKKAKKLVQYRNDMRKATDADLRLAKAELENDLLSTKKKKKLVEIEKRIEAIEDIQAARGIYGGAAMAVARAVASGARKSKKQKKALKKGIAAEQKATAKAVQKEAAVAKKSAAKEAKAAAKEAKAAAKAEKKAAAAE